MIKIQLDSKALEALIGGNSETELELRNSVSYLHNIKRYKGLKRTYKN